MSCVLPDEQCIPRTNEIDLALIPHLFRLMFREKDWTYVQVLWIPKMDNIADIFLINKYICASKTYNIINNTYWKMGNVGIGNLRMIL